MKDLLTASGLDVNVGLVQTAYSNGNSTKYVTNQLVRVIFHGVFMMENVFYFFYLESTCCLCSDRCQVPSP